MEDEPNLISFGELKNRTELSDLSPFEWSMLKQMAEDSSSEHIISVGENGKLLLDDVKNEIRVFGKTNVVGHFQDAVGSNFDSIRGSGGQDSSKWPSALKTLPNPSQEGFVDFLKSIATKTLTPVLNKQENLDPNTTGVSTEHVLSVPNVSQETQNSNDIGYIRFVRASKLRGAKDLSHTVPGYVTFQKIKAPSMLLFYRNQSDFEKEVKKVHAAKAQWAFDGPRSGIKPVQNEVDTLGNIDTPGEMQTRKEHFPYVLITDFISVIFNKTTSEVINVVEYNDMLSVYEDPFADQRGSDNIDIEQHQKLMNQFT